MTKAEALHAFMSSFDWTAYPNQAVPDADGKDPAFPYLVYEQNIGSIDNGQISTVINLWDYSTSTLSVLNKTEEINNKIGLGGIYVPYDGGAINIQRSDPAPQGQTDQADVNIRGMYITITLEYLS